MKKSRLNFFIKSAIVTFIGFCVITIVKQQFTLNEIKASISEVSGAVAEKELSIEELNDTLSHPFDRDYVIRIAREKLNYCLPDEVIFYSDR